MPQPTARPATAAEIPAENSAGNSFRWTALPPIPSYILWDDESWYAINAHQLKLAREAGALARVPMGLITGAVIDAWSGEFARASEATAEAASIVEATGVGLAPYAAILLVALQSREADGLGTDRDGDRGVRRPGARGSLSNGASS